MLPSFSKKIKVDGVAKNDEDEIRAFMKSTKKMHEFFTYCMGEFSVENFCAWYMIEVFRKNPRKRMADFIIENYIKDESADHDKFGPFTSALNLPRRFKGADRKEVNLKDVEGQKAQARSNYAGIDRSLYAKVRREGFVGALKMKSGGRSKPDLDLFDTLQEAVMINLLDSYSRFRVAGPIDPKKHEGDAIRVFKQAITEAGWSPRELGIW